MTIKRITAIVPLDILEPMERHLRACGVPGVTVEQVKGYGEHPNFFRRDLMYDNARLVLYADEDNVAGIVSAIARCAKESHAQAGLLAVESIDRLVNLSNGDDVTAPSLAQ